MVVRFHLVAPILDSYMRMWRNGRRTALRTQRFIRAGSTPVIRTNRGPEVKLYLDDKRDPPDEIAGSHIVVRSYEEAVQLVKDFGFPEEVWFDHDLGTDKTGLDFAHFLIDLDLDTGAMPGNFSYRIHSANPVGRANIAGLLDGYLRFRHGLDERSA